MAIETRRKGAVTFRADQAQPFLAHSPVRLGRAEGAAFLAMLVVLGGLGALLAWAPWAGACAAMTIAALKTRDGLISGRVGLALAPFYCLTLFGGLGIFILGGVWAGASLLAR